MLLSRSVCGLRVFSCALFVLLISAQPTVARFIFELELHAVNTRGVCFGDLTLPCETYLSTFCLRPSSETSGCSLGSSGRHGPGGSLPITRRISSNSPWPVSFQLFIRARDEDNPGSDDDLDDIYITRSRQPNVGFTQLEEHFGNNGKVSVTLRYRISCQSNFYGGNCATFCSAQDDGINGHYTCSNNDGSIQCRDGFENPSNNCRDRITACSSSPCEQGAQCTPIDLTDYSCDCPAGFTGKSCETDVNECDPNPCQNDGHCTDLLADYMCSCLAGYSGKDCGIDIDDCAGVECPGNSICIDEVDSFTCVCNLGFEGENCTEINPCDVDSSPCANNGSCVPMGPFNYTCQCADGYTGPACEDDIDECLTAVCPTNSKCIDDINSYNCVCNAGFEGDQCTQKAVGQLDQVATDGPMLHITTKKNITTAVIGAVIGGLVIAITIILIIIVLLFIFRKRRTKHRSYSLPGELSATSTFSTEDSHIYQSGEDFKEGTSTAPNPLYNTSQHQNGVPSSADPYYSYVSSTTCMSPDHSSTLHIVPNPIYGTQSPSHSSDGVYSVPKPMKSGTKDAAEEYPYSYARVETSRTSLRSSSGSVVKKDQAVSHLPPPPSYEYITMGSAEPASSGKSEEEPTCAVTLNHPSSGANGNTRAVFKRSIYDDDFQYEIVEVNGSVSAKVSDSTADLHPDSKVKPVPAPRLKPGATPQSNHYDIPRANGSPGKPTETTPTHGTTMTPPPYDKLNHGSDFTKPQSSERLGKIEGSGYELLNKTS